MAQTLNKAIVRKDKLAAGYNGNLESIKRVAAEMENGMIFALGDNDTGAREVVLVKEPKDIDVANDVFVLHASPELVYNEATWIDNDGNVRWIDQLGDFSVGAGKVGRAYHLFAGDIFTVSNKLIKGTPAVGKFVVPFADATDAQTMQVVDAYTTEKLVLKIIELEDMGKGRFGISLTQPSTVLRVVRA